MNVAIRYITVYWALKRCRHGFDSSDNNLMKILALEVGGNLSTHSTNVYANFHNTTPEIRHGQHALLRKITVIESLLANYVCIIYFYYEAWTMKPFIDPFFPQFQSSGQKEVIIMEKDEQPRKILMPLWALL